MSDNIVLWGSADSPGEEDLIEFRDRMLHTLEKEVYFECPSCGIGATDIIDKENVYDCPNCSITFKVIKLLPQGIKVKWL